MGLHTYPNTLSLDTQVVTVHADRAAYNIRSLYAFLLQDAPTSKTTLTGFGRFNESGQAKPAEHTVARIFRQEGLTTAAARTALRRLLSANRTSELRRN